MLPGSDVTMSDSALTFKGGQAMVGRLESVGARMLVQIPAALLGEAKDILEDSKQNYVPIDEGVLIEDNDIIGPSVQGDITTVDIAFGLGGAAAYAEFVHEHPTHSRKNKYLEKPIRAAAPGMAAALSRRLKV